jgi:predicted DNA-binding transcriptional regulator AlpA
MQLCTQEQIAQQLAMDVKAFKRHIKTAPDFPRPAFLKSQKIVRWDQAEINEWLKKQKAGLRR